MYNHNESPVSDFIEFTRASDRERRARGELLAIARSGPGMTPDRRIVHVHASAPAPRPAPAPAPRPTPARSTPPAELLGAQKMAALERKLGLEDGSHLAPDARVLRLERRSGLSTPTKAPPSSSPPRLPSAAKRELDRAMGLVPQGPKAYTDAGGRLVLAAVADVDEEEAPSPPERRTLKDAEKDAVSSRVDLLEEELASTNFRLGELKMRVDSIENGSLKDGKLGRKNPDPPKDPPPTPGQDARSASRRELARKMGLVSSKPAAVLHSGGVRLVLGGWDVDPEAA